MAVVLLVDDSPVVRLVAARRLRAAGLEVEERDSFATARDVPEGLSCALLDHDLGDGRGSDLVPFLGGVPFAFFTSEEDTTALAKLGRVFRKPDELDAAVAWALSVAG